MIRLKPTEKRCPLCGEVKHRYRDFYPRGKDPLKVRAYCKRCDGAKASTWQRDNREKVRAAKRAENARTKADPERYAVSLEIRRNSYRRRFGVTPDRYRIKAERADPAAVVPLAPFVAWLRTLGSTSSSIAEACGLAERQIRGYLGGEYSAVSIDVVDRACLNMSKDLDEMYPLVSTTAAA